MHQGLLQSGQSYSSCYCYCYEDRDDRDGIRNYGYDDYVLLTTTASTATTTTTTRTAVKVLRYRTLLQCYNARIVERGQVQTPTFQVKPFLEETSSFTKLKVSGAGRADEDPALCSNPGVACVPSISCKSYIIEMHAHLCAFIFICRFVIYILI